MVCFAITEFAPADIGLFWYVISKSFCLGFNEMWQLNAGNKTSLQNGVNVSG